MPKFHFTQNSFSNSQERPTWLPSLCELFIIYGESKSTGDSIVKQLLIDQQNSAHASVIASDFQISTQNLRIPPKPHKRLWVLRLSRWLPWRESERPPPKSRKHIGSFSPRWRPRWSQPTIPDFNHHSELPCCVSEERSTAERRRTAAWFHGHARVIYDRDEFILHNLKRAYGFEVVNGALCYKLVQIDLPLMSRLTNMLKLPKGSAF